MSEIKILSEKDKVRQKISVWLESSKNHMHTIKELVGNSNDLIIQGIGDTIKVNVSDDCKQITIEDNCTGLPVEGETNGTPNYVALFETLFASTKYDQTEYTVGTNGVFLCVLTYSSKDIKYTIGRPDGNVYQIEYHKGDRLYNLKIVGTTDKTFTRIEYTLDDEVYDNPVFDINEIETILETQSAISNVIITLNHKSTTKIYNHNNVYNYLVSNLKDKPLVDIININKNCEIYVPKKDRNDKIIVNMALTFTNTTDDITQVELLNGSMLDLHGTPYDGIILGMKNSIHKYLKDNNLYKTKEKAISNDDVILSLRHCLDLKSMLTEFTNQTKRSTLALHYKQVMQTVVEEFMNVYFIENKREANIICNQILLNKRVSESAEKTRANIKKKLSEKIDTINNRVDGFYDCEIDGGELFLCEGDSAKGSIVLARDSKFQAVYPLRGKLINALKADDKQLFNNEEVIDIIKLLNCGIEVKNKFTKEFPQFDIGKLRFNKIILCSDADVDGRQINALILTLLYKLMSSLIKEGKVFIAQPPLFEIKVTDNEWYYAQTISERDNIVNDLKLQGKKVTIHRLKGLGEMNQVSMYNTVCNPETRMIQQVTVSDIEQMSKTFKVWMDTEVTDRKEIIENKLNKYVIEPPVVDITESKDVVEIVNDNMMDYSAEVILDRAIVSVESGLKPSQQKILWAMKENNRTKLTKSMNVVGDVTAYHEHGSAYPTIVNMTQKDRHILPLVYGEGNFGQYTSKHLMYASDRYTNVKLSELALEGLKEIDDNYVEMISNYDGKKKMPLYLPNKYPLILTQSSQGMAVGMASKIPSFNLNEVNSAIIKYLSTNEKTILIPDFATYGKIDYNENIIKQINEIGKGTLSLRGDYEIDKNNVIITELPYGVYREEIIDKVVENIKKGQLKEVLDIKDLTDLKGMKIKITCKKNTDMDSFINKLFKMTSLQSTFACNMNVLYKGYPKVCSVWEIIDNWLEFRKECIIRSMKFKINKLNNEIEIYEGLKLIFDNIDRVIEIIRFEEYPEITLQNEFGLNEKQSKYISNMKLFNLNKKSIQQSLDKLNSLIEELNELKININSDEYIKSVIIKDLEYINSKYITPRRTEITSFEKIKTEELVEDYNAVCYLTNDGYFKKVRLTANKGNNKLKDGDSVKTILNTTNSSEIIFFGEDLNCYKFRLSELEETKLSNMGTYLPNMIDTKIIGMSTINDLYKYVLIIFNNNSIAKISLDSYKTKQNRKVLNKSLANNDVFDIITLEEDKEITITVSDGRTKTINTKDLTLNKSRNSSGSKQINWRNVNIINVDICRNI